MPVVLTEIAIDADVQTVWSVFDDLDRYPEWNPILPRMAGRTMLDQKLDGDLVIEGLPTPPLTPRVTRVVPLRELRWLMEVPGDDGFTAEHIFIFTPTASGTHMVHKEVFSGPGAAVFDELGKSHVGPSYERFNRALKDRAESLARSAPELHPSIDQGMSREPSTPMTLRCHCEANPVVVELTEPVRHNHLCGCSKCWKPDSSILAQIAVVPRDSATVAAGGAKLTVVDLGQSIRRKACADCGVHMVGEVDDPDHHFYGLTFVHPELAIAGSVGAPEFSAFLSSLIGNGIQPSLMQAIRHRLDELAIPTFDGFSTEISDAIAFHALKLRRPSSPA